jgi:cell division septal protein FtsQ
LPEDRTPRRRPEANKRPQQAALPHKRRWPFILAGISLIAFAAATFWALRSPYFEVQQVRVQGTETLDRRALVQVSGLLGESMFKLPVSDVRSRLHDVPQVRSVSIHQTWPNTVTLKIEERVPYAYWVVDGRAYTVDVEGVVLATGVPSGPAPRIVEPDSTRIMGPGDRVHPDALALAARIAKESPRFLNQTVRELEYRQGIGVTAVFSDGMKVTFGDERSYEYKVAVLTQLLERLSARSYTPRSVDLRFGERVTYE